MEYKDRVLNDRFDSYPAKTNRLAGGIKKQCNILEELKQSHAEYNPQVTGKDMGELAYVEQFNRLETPIVLNVGTATFEDIACHARIRQRLSKGTIERNLRYLRYMEKHPCPVNLREPSYENFIRHMDYREQIENSKWGALKHEWQAMVMLLRAHGINTKEWYYKPPKRAQYHVIPIPFPKQVHTIIHMEYSKDPYVNALIKYLLCHNYVIGWRPPSEPSIIKTTDVDVDNGILKVTSPKLHGATRNLDISEIATRHTALCFKNWIDHWRPKVENQYSGDYLYLKPNGKPFSNPESLRMLLNKKAQKKIQQVFPEYYNYTSRHFCAIARLIRTKIETKKFDEYSVLNWLGHTKIETTIGYLKHAEFYYQKAPYDWIKCVLKFCNNAEGENTLKIDKHPKNLGYEWNSLKRASRRPPDSNRRPFG